MKKALSAVFAILVLVAMVACATDYNVEGTQDNNITGPVEDINLDVCSDNFECGALEMCVKHEVASAKFGYDVYTCKRGCDPDLVTHDDGTVSKGDADTCQRDGDKSLVCDPSTKLCKKLTEETVAPECTKDEDCDDGYVCDDDKCVKERVDVDGDGETTENEDVESTENDVDTAGNKLTCTFSNCRSGYDVTIWYGGLKNEHDPLRVSCGQKVTLAYEDICNWGAPAHIRINQNLNTVWNYGNELTVDCDVTSTRQVLNQGLTELYFRTIDCSPYYPYYQ